MLHKNKSFGKDFMANKINEIFLEISGEEFYLNFDETFLSFAFRAEFLIPKSPKDLAPFNFYLIGEDHYFVARD